MSSLNPDDIKNNTYLYPPSLQSGINKLMTNNATQAVNTHTFVNSCLLLFCYNRQLCFLNVTIREGIE